MELESPAKQHSQAAAAGESGLRECCKQTIEDHAIHNPMMLCQVCKHLIKCFSSESCFRNYVKFCESRGRQVYVDRFQNYYIVVYRNYEPYR